MQRRLGVLTTGAAAGAGRPRGGPSASAATRAAPVVPLAARARAAAGHGDQRPVVDHAGLADVAWRRDDGRLAPRARAGDRAAGLERLGAGGQAPAEHRYDAGRQVHDAATPSATAPTPGPSCATGTWTATTCGPTSRATRRRTTSTSPTAPRRRTGAPTTASGSRPTATSTPTRWCSGTTCPPGCTGPRRRHQYVATAPGEAPAGRRDLPARAAEQVHRRLRRRTAQRHPVGGALAGPGAEPADRDGPAGLGAPDLLTLA